MLRLLFSIFVVIGISGCGNYSSQKNIEATNTQLTSSDSTVVSSKPGGKSDVKQGRGKNKDAPTEEPVVEEVSTPEEPTMAPPTQLDECRMKLDIDSAYHSSGNAYKLVGGFGATPDSSGNGSASTLVIFENNKALGPAHSSHADIRNQGMGRFSHWKSSGGQEALYFSSSDNTNPLSNGRTYTVSSCGDQAAGDPPPAESPISLLPSSNNFSYGIPVSFTPQSDAYKSRSPLGVGQSLVNEKYATVTIRLTDGISHHYSKRQAFNSNETLINLRGQVIDAKTLSIVSGYQPGISNIERNWSNTNPNLIYGIGSDGGSFVRHDLSTGMTTTIMGVSGYSSCTIGSHEGNMTMNDRYVYLDCSKDGSKYGLSLDLVGKQVLGTIKLSSEHNWGGFSQGGNFIVLQGDSSNGRKAKVYDKYLKFQRDLSDKLYHGDFGWDDQGNEIYAAISWDYVHYYRLKDAQLVYTAGGTNHGHLSCRNIKRPGYCYISSNSGEIAAIKMSTGGHTNTISGSVPNKKGIDGVDVVEFMDHHRSNQNVYEAQAKASVSPSGTKVIYNSNWYGKIGVSAFMVEFMQ